MTSYDAAPSSTTAQDGQRPLADKIGQLFGFERATPGPGPALDYVLSPDKDGKLVLAGYRVPLAIAVIGAAAAGALLLNRRTRLPVLAAATTAWGYLAKKAA